MIRPTLKVSRGPGAPGFSVRLAGYSGVVRAASRVVDSRANQRLVAKVGSRTPKPQVVNVAGIWLRSSKEQQFRDYYSEVVPIAKRNGLEPITPLKPMLSYKGDFLPDFAGLNLWYRQQNFDVFAGEAAHLFPRRDDAVRRLEVTHALVRLQGEAR